jgi:four helix bundle protein
VGVYRFEDLRVWQAAKEQCDRVGQLIKRPEFRRDQELSAQMNGASLSVMLNISEGFLRRRDREMLQFLRVAAASNGEVRACYHAAHGRAYLDERERDELLALNASIARMTRRFQATLDGPRTKDGPGTKDGPSTKHQVPRTKTGCVSALYPAQPLRCRSCPSTG